MPVIDFSIWIESDNYIGDVAQVFCAQHSKMEPLMAIDLEKMSEKDLRDLRTKIDKSLSTMQTRKLADARKAAEEAARKHGYSLSDLVGGKPAKAKSPAKYRNPADSSKTWSGRGRQPGWIKDALAKGKKLDDFAI